MEPYSSGQQKSESKGMTRVACMSDISKVVHVTGANLQGPERPHGKGSRDGGPGRRVQIYS